MFILRTRVFSPPLKTVMVRTEPDLIRPHVKKILTKRRQA